MFERELDPHLLRNGYSQTPPEMAMPLTPMMPHMAQMGHFVHMNATPYDPEGDSRFLNMAGVSNGMMEINDNMLNDFMTSPSILQDPHDMMFMNRNGVVPTPAHMGILTNGHSRNHSRVMELETPPHHVHQRMRSGPSPSSSSTVSGLQEPDAVLTLHPNWPYFQCQRVGKSTTVQPKTAGIYLEGLAQTLKNQTTWQAWTAQLDERMLDISFERKISTEPIVGWSREKLLAITQGFLHKALDIHKVRQTRDDSPASPDSTNETFLMLPPPEVMQFFLRSYVVRYEPYYSSIPGGRLDPNSLMHSSNSKAASLLILLMVASGASATHTPEGRYVASGLTEACRVSLFDTVEKDVAQAREVLVLRSALLLICLAAWSGDKWHMDMAMGQRGLYLAVSISHLFFELC